MKNKADKVAADLAGEVLNEVSDQFELSQARNDKRSKGKKSTAVVIPAVTLLGLIGLIGLYFATQPDPGPPLTLGEQRYAALDEMSELVYDLDDYREEYGALPNDLLLLGKSKYPDLSYKHLSGDHYRVSHINGSQALVYDSAEPAYQFFADVRGVE